jgi:PAS domain S-box-containing protein
MFAVVERTMRLVDADGAAVAMLDGDQLVWSYGSGVAAKHVGLRMPVERSLCGLALTLGETVWSGDTLADSRSDRNAAQVSGMRSMIAAPLEREGSGGGVLVVMSERTNAFRELAVETTRLMAQFVSGVSRNADELETRRRLVERLRLQGQVVEHMQTALWVCRVHDGSLLRVEYANAASEQATGLAVADVVGRDVQQISSSIEPRLIEQVIGVLESGVPLDLGELEYGQREPRNVLHLKVFPLPGDRLAFAFENVTVRVHAHRALQESESRFRSAFDSASIGASLTTLDGRFVQANDRLCELLGYAGGELADLTWAAVLEPDEYEAFDIATNELLHGERDHFLCEARLRRKDGGDAWARVGVSLVRDYAGDPLYYVTHVEDVGERHALEAQLRQAQKMEAVGRLAGGIAHDFNNLLTAISGYTEFLIAGLEDERLRRQAEEIKRAAGRAAGLTGQLLAFSRRQVLQPRVLDLNAIVVELELMLRRVIGEDVDLVALLDPELGRVQADPTQIEQVIINLAVNAREAMPRGGSLSVATTNVVVDGTPAVELRLTDTGIGMSEEQRQRIFEPFFTTKEGGTGLGLATVYGIVEQSGGTIVVDSEPGIGTSVSITLPRVDAAVETVAPAPDEGLRAGSETILLVEDEAIVRSLVAEILESIGYSVLQAADGPAALELLRRHGGVVDLLLTDVVMPGMSGREVAEAVTSTSPSTQVLFMSGYTGSVIDYDGIVGAGFAFLQKPFTSEELGRRIRGLLDRAPV